MNLHERFLILFEFSIQLRLAIGARHVSPALMDSISGRMYPAPTELRWIENPLGAGRASVIATFDELKIKNNALRKLTSSLRH